MILINIINNKEISYAPIIYFSRNNSYLLTKLICLFCMLYVESKNTIIKNK